MPTYTGTADINGDFNIPFLENYTSGEKITVTATKDAATRSIDIFAPSEPIPPITLGIISFDGDPVNFDTDVGTMRISGVSGAIGDSRFAATTTTTVFRRVTGLIINEGVTSLGSRAFEGWRKLISFDMPSSITSIGTYCFNDCHALSSLTLSPNLTTIPTYAFYSCGQLIELDIPDLVSSVRSNAFTHCGKLKKLTLGSGLTLIESGAFANASLLEEIIVKATTPPAITSTSFSNLPSSCVIKVPLASLSTYQATPNWSAFASQMVGV